MPGLIQEAYGEVESNTTDNFYAYKEYSSYVKYGAQNTILKAQLTVKGDLFLSAKNYVLHNLCSRGGAFLTTTSKR